MERLTDRRFLPAATFVLLMAAGGVVMLQNHESYTGPNIPTQGQGLDVPPIPLPTLTAENLTFEQIVQEAQDLFDFSKQMQGYQIEPKTLNKDRLFQAAQQRIVKAAHP